MNVWPDFSVDGWQLHADPYWDGYDVERTWYESMHDDGRIVPIHVSDFDFQMTKDRFTKLVRLGFPRAPRDNWTSETLDAYEPKRMTPEEACPYDGRECYVVEAIDDGHFRCGTSACGRKPRAKAMETRQGQDATRLGAKHDSAAPSGVCRNEGNMNHQSEIARIAAENKRLRFHLGTALETLRIEGCCGPECVACTEARALLEQEQS